MTTGGDGGRLSPAACRKIARSKTGLVASEETRAKMRQSQLKFFASKAGAVRKAIMAQQKIDWHTSPKGVKFGKALAERMRIEMPKRKGWGWAPIWGDPVKRAALLAKRALVTRWRLTSANA